MREPGLPENETQRLAALASDEILDTRPELQYDGHTGLGPVDLAALCSAVQEPIKSHMKPRIAIVEDDADNRMLLEELLSDRYDISAYEDGIVGLAAMHANPPQVVLLDISLPSMPGSEVLARMRTESVLAAIPVIALTAHGMPDDRARFLAQGFDAYISKPILDDSVLYTEIDRALANGRSS